MSDIVRCIQCDAPNSPQKKKTLWFCWFTNLDTSTDDEYPQILYAGYVQNETKIYAEN